MWADVLDAVAELADVIVPGHGPVGGEREVRELQQYLPLIVCAGTIPPGAWDAWPERDPRDAINIERAELLRSGRDEMPPAMLASTTTVIGARPRRLIPLNQPAWARSCARLSMCGRSTSVRVTMPTR